MARIQELTLKSGATVTMHTKLSFLEARHIAKRRVEIRKMKDEEKAEFEGLALFVTGWTLRNVETDEPLPFDAKGLGNADLVDVGEIVEKMTKVEAGQDPNAPSASSPAT